MSAHASPPDRSRFERCPGVFRCPRSGGIVYRFIMDSPYTKTGLNSISDCGKYIWYAESVARSDERRRQIFAHENRQSTVVEVRKNWRNTNRDTDTFVGLFMHTGKIREKSVNGRGVRSFQLKRID